MVSFIGFRVFGVNCFIFGFHLRNRRDCNRGSCPSRVPSQIGGQNLLKPFSHSVRYPLDKPSFVLRSKMHEVRLVGIHSISHDSVV